MAKRLALFAFAALLLVSLSHPQAGEQVSGQICAAAVTPTYMDVTQDPASSQISVFVYNKSATYEKFGIEKAMVIRINISDPAKPSFCYQIAGAQGSAKGWATFAYDPEMDGCTDYWFIFCPLGKNNFGECLKGTGLPVPSSIGRCAQYSSEPEPPAVCTGQLLSHNELYFCNQRPKNYAALCWPLLLIFGLLVGASFALGKNPFEAFDFSSPRMGRGRQYTMRVQQRSFDLLTYAFAADKAAETAGKTASFIGGGKDAIVNGETVGEIGKNCKIADKDSADGQIKKGDLVSMDGKTRIAEKGDFTTAVHDPGWRRYTPIGLIQMGTAKLAGTVAGWLRSDRIAVGGETYTVKNGIAYDQNNLAIGWVSVDDKGNRSLVALTATGTLMVPMVIPLDESGKAKGIVLEGGMAKGSSQISEKEGGKSSAQQIGRTMTVSKDTSPVALLSPDLTAPFNLDKAGMSKADADSLKNDGVFGFLYKKILANSGMSEANSVLDYVWVAYSTLSFMSGHMRGMGGKGIGFIENFNSMKVAGLRVDFLSSCFDPSFAGQYGVAGATQLVSPLATLVKSVAGDAYMSLAGDLKRPEQQFARGVRNEELGITFVINDNGTFSARKDDGTIISDKAELIRHLRESGEKAGDLLAYVERGAGAKETALESLKELGFVQSAYFSKDAEGRLNGIGQKAYDSGIEQWGDHLNAELRLIDKVLMSKPEGDPLLKAERDSIETQILLLDAMAENSGKGLSALEQTMMLQMQYRNYQDAREQLEKAKYLESELEREGSQLKAMHASADDNRKAGLENMVEAQALLGLASLTAAEAITSTYNAGIDMDHAMNSLNRFNAAIKSTNDEELKATYAALTGGKKEEDLTRMKLAVVGAYSQQMSRTSYILQRAETAEEGMVPTGAQKFLRGQAEHLLESAASAKIGDLNNFNYQLASAAEHLMQSHDYDGAVLENSSKEGGRFDEQLQAAFRKVADKSMEYLEKGISDPAGTALISGRLTELADLESVLYKTSEDYIDSRAKGRGEIFAPSYLGTANEKFLEEIDEYKRIHFGPAAPVGKNKDSESLYGDIALSLSRWTPPEIREGGEGPELPRAALSELPPVVSVDNASREREFIRNEKSPLFKQNVENVSGTVQDYYEKHKDYYARSGENLVVAVNFPVEKYGQEGLNERFEQRTMEQVKARLAEAGVPIEKVSFITRHEETMTMERLASEEENWKVAQKQFASGRAYGEDGQRLSRLIDADDYSGIKKAKTYEEFQAAVKNSGYEGEVYMPDSSARKLYDPMRSTYIGPASQFDVVEGKAVLKEKKK